MGLEPRRVDDRIFDRVPGKSFFRRWSSQSLDALRKAALRDHRAR